MSYNCLSCGCFVMDGMVHSCSPTVAPAVPIFPVPVATWQPAWAPAAPVVANPFTVTFPLPFTEADRLMLQEAHAMLKEIKALLGWTE